MFLGKPKFYLSLLKNIIYPFLSRTRNLNVEWESNVVENILKEV
jgi:hypothetical protein